MRVFGVNWGWYCCTSEPAQNESHDDDWAVHRDERLKGSTPRPSQAYLSAEALHPLGGRPRPSVLQDDWDAVRQRSVSESTIGPCTPSMVRAQPVLEDQDGSTSQSLSDFQELSQLSRLSPRSVCSEGDGSASSTGRPSVGDLKQVSSPRMSASDLLKQVTNEGPREDQYGRSKDPPQSSGHTIYGDYLQEIMDEAQAQDTPRSRRSQGRSARSSSSSQLKGRSRSSSSVSVSARAQRSSSRTPKGRSPSARSRLDRHLEDSMEETGPPVQERRSSRATTEQATSSASMLPKDEGRHRTWSGPYKSEESKGKEKGRTLDVEAISQWSDGSTALNTKGSRLSTSTSRTSRSLLSGRLLGSSATPSDRSLSRSSSTPATSRDTRNTAVILVDWDDTLCPTSWVFEQIRRCPDNKALAAVERAAADLLQEHAITVVAFLRAACACARVAVVTLATEEFFHQSADTFLQHVRVRDLFEELGIEVHFAERPTQMSFPAEIDAKKKAMSQCLSKMYAGRHLTRWNVLSVGDSEIELEALKSLLGSKWRSPLCKTVKFDARPTLTQLTGQLKSVTPNLAAMMASGKGFHITSHSKWPQ